MQRPRLRARRSLPGFAVAWAMVLSATPSLAQLPAADSARLQARMSALHHAMAARDAAAWYALTAVAARRQMTLEEFKTDFRLDSVADVTTPPTVQVSLDRVCRCMALPGQPDALRCVAVLTLAPDSLPQHRGRWIESWDRMDHEWYWVYGQPHTSNPPPQPPRCPGES